MNSATDHLRVAFRTDASIEIGTGHVMRCLTLAAALRERGASSVFLCREHEGNLLHFIAEQGHKVLVLPRNSDARLATGQKRAGGEPPHAHWLGTNWETDVADSLKALSEGSLFDWMVVDHYGLDARWEEALRPAVDRLMAIDDLADRPHDCDLLLDQSLGRSAADYAALVPQAATVLTGPRYALLRPEFARLRAESLARREQPRLQSILVTLGGVDKDNATERVLEALDGASLPDDVVITVVMGPKAPWLHAVRARAARMRHPTEVLVGVSDMARLMAESDFAIGAGGTTTWERCALGLPAVQVSLAENQREINLAIGRAQAALQCDVSEVGLTLIDVFSDKQLLKQLAQTSRAAARVSDGCGAPRVVQSLLGNAT